MTSPVIDVHTHNYSESWLNLLRKHGAPRYEVKVIPGGREAIHHDGAAFNTIFPAFFDVEARIKAMNTHGVDISVVSLAAPNVFWGTAEVSLRAAQAANDQFAQWRTAYPDRIRWYATLPWMHADLAVPELDRAVKNGASGVVTLANIAEKSLTDALFAPVWKAIDDRGLPVLVHPTAPPAVGGLEMAKYMLIVPIGFPFDSTLAVGRMIFDGFFDTYKKLKIISTHGGGALPYLISRFDRCHEKIESARLTIKERPSTYMHRLYLDTVVYSPDVLEMAIKVVGEDNVLYGSDFPHNISDMPGILKLVDALPAGTKDKVRGRNQERIFNL